MEQNDEGKLNYTHFNGVFAAPFAPMSEDGTEIKPELISQYSEDLVSQGVTGVYVCGTSGEVFSLTVEERKQILEAWVSTKEFKSGSLFIIAHIGCLNLPDTLMLSKHASDLKVNALAVIPPFYYKIKSEEQVLDWINPIANAFQHIPFYYYHFPQMSGINISLAKLLQVGRDERKISNLIGAKFSHTNFEDMAECTRLGFHILAGACNTFLTSLQIGAHGSIGRDTNYSGALHRKILDCHLEGDIDKAIIFQKKSSDLIELMRSMGDQLIPTCKYLVYLLRGINLGGVRLPMTNITNEIKEKIEKHKDEFISFASI